jgi:hypothetical protein
MDGGPVATHKGVRVDDVVDSAPRLSDITVAEQGSRESGRFDMLASVGLTKQHLVSSDRDDVCVDRSL